MRALTLRSLTHPSPIRALPPAPIPPPRRSILTIRPITSTPSNMSDPAAPNACTSTARSPAPPPPETDASTSPPTEPLLALPAGPSQGAAPALDVSGAEQSVRLDYLGPMVVNTDGTMSRVANWAAMTEAERANTLRIIGKRNRERMEALGKKEEEEQQGAGRGGGVTT